MSASLSASASFTPSPVIATTWPRGLQRADHRPLLLRCHASEHAVLVEHRGQLVGIFGQRTGVEAFTGVLEADLACNRRDRPWVVTGDHPEAHSLLREERQGLRGVGTNSLGEAHQRTGLETFGETLFVRRMRAVGEDEHPLPVARQRVGPSADAAAVGQHHLRRAEHPRAAAVERRRAPLARRRERHGSSLRPTRIGVAGAQRQCGRVGVLVGSERAERAVDLRGLGITVDELEGIEDDLALREGPRLVEAHDVDTRQAFDRGELLDQHLAARQRDRRDREGHAREQDEALRHHAHDAGHRRAQRLLDRIVAQLAPHEQRGGRNQGPHDEAQDQVDAVHELRAREREAPRLDRELARVRVGTDPCRLEPPAPRDDDASRQDLVAVHLGHRVALAGQERLVDLEALVRVHDAVGRHLITGREHHEIVEHDLFDARLRPVTRRAPRARSAC